ncbi:MAG: hypothetical protein Q7K40_05255 [bacterium]|nr:hypothetical protein [bacterium]
MINNKNLGIIGLVILALVAGVLIYKDTRGSKIEITGDTGDTLKNLGIDMTGDAKVEIVPVQEKKLPPAPELVRATDFPGSLSPEIKKIALSHIEAIIVALKKDPKNVDNWIELGLQRKAIGDYEGARDAWEYAKALDPQNVVPWGNLGDLYHFYLKNYTKSEENWKKLIALKPSYVHGYRGLYELYMYSMKEKSTQIPVFLNEGIRKNPTSTDLKALFADYEKSLITP